MVKLNIGCWKRNFPGFINIDVIPYPHVHFNRDASDLSMFEDDSVDLVYASHVLEYFTYPQAEEALKEWNRVLRPGGELRVAVPDLEALIKVYEKYHDPLMLRGSIYAITDKVLETNGNLVFHKMIYDEKLLTSLLERCGFTNVGRYDWREFLPEGVLDRSVSYIPRMDFEHGILVSLNLKAQKAGKLEAATLQAKHTAADFKKRVFRKIEKTIKGDVSHPKELYKE